MPRGLTQKLDFEKGRRQAPASAPDYRERFAAEGDQFDRGGIARRQITLSDAAKLLPARRKALRDDKARAIEVFVRHLRGQTLRVQGHRYRLGANVAEFAKLNDISLATAERQLPAVAAEAEERLRLTVGRARQAELQFVAADHPEATRPQGNWCLRFRTFLPTAEPVDWSKVFKRVHLQPTDEADAAADA